MNRIEIDVITGERTVVELTAEEVAQAQAQYVEWLAAQPTVATPIASARVIEQLPDLLQMTGLELSPSELDELSAVSV